MSLPTSEELDSWTDGKLSLKFPRIRPILKITRNDDGSINVPMRRRIMRLMYGRDLYP